MPRRGTVALSLALVLSFGACAAPVTGPPPSEPDAGSATTQATAAPARCPHFTNGERVGQVGDPDLAEISGLAASRRNPGVLWVHEDSGNPADLVALDTDGAVAARFRLAGVSARDWEDVAVGPGPDSATSYVYLGDIGDNLGDQASFRVVRVPEPKVDPARASAARTELGGAVTLAGRYPDGSHDAETLLSDPRSGDLFVVTKSDKGRSGVYRWPAPQAPNATTVLEAVATVDVNGLDGAMDRRVTAGDISPDGAAVLLRTYTNAWMWRRGGDESVADALAGDPCPVPLQFERQGEAIGWDAAGDAYFSTTEGARPPILRYGRE